MLATKTITICGKEVEMLYCAATETGYEQLVSGTGKDINVFLPTVLERDADGKPTKVEPPVAQTDDYLKLALAAIIAAAARKKQDPPVSADEVMYDASSQEVTNMITAIIELRTQWYIVPEAVKPETDETPKDGEVETKNA